MWQAVAGFFSGIILSIGAWFGVGASPDEQPHEEPVASTSAMVEGPSIERGMHVDAVPITVVTDGGGDQVTPLASDGTDTSRYATATLAGGCFWSTESDLEKVPGVIAVVSGYSGGTSQNPTYANYKAGGHREVVQVTYDPMKVSYAGLAEYMLKHTDPTDAGGTFYDRGQNYRAALYHATENERIAAEKVIAQLNNAHVYDDPVVAPVLPAQTFWPAEEYHQDYAKKNPLQYGRYRTASGRQSFIEDHWGDQASVITNKVESISAPASPSITAPSAAPWKSFVKPSDEMLEATLSPLAYRVTQEEGTESAFHNAYHDTHEEGIYVDVVSGEPLFSSTDKYDSGTGWPSFTKPLVPEHIVTREDHKLFMKRTEVRSKYADSHLGHVFNDGPAPTGLRYCMNSAALRFIRKEDLVSEGYGAFAYLFE